MFNRPVAGFTLIEMVVAIVIIGVGLAGVLTAFTTTVKSSADPLIHKQMLAVAEEMLEEVLLKPFDPVAPAVANSLKSCDGALPPSREGFNDVRDFSGYQTTGICDTEGAAVAGLATYNLAVVIDAATASLDSVPSSGAISGVNVMKITVTVTHGTETVTLNGWRTKYATP
jgi:MSHA pilin protein MshD